MRSMDRRVSWTPIGRLTDDDDRVTKGKRTGLALCIVLVGEIAAVDRAGSEDAPESTTAHALPQTGDVNMHNHTAILKWLGELFAVDVVVVERTDEDGEVIMAVCESLCERRAN